MSIAMPDSLGLASDHRKVASPPGASAWIDHESLRVAFYPSLRFHRWMLEPIYAQLRFDLPCLIADDLNEIRAFRPDVLVVAGNKYRLYRTRVPGAIIVRVRHGFSNKNMLKKMVEGSDFCCVTSEWTRDEYMDKGWHPRLGYWVTGFVPMDRVLTRQPGASELALPAGFTEGHATLLYAPTWNRYLSSAPLMGSRWIDQLRESNPDVNIVIKPHPVLARTFPRVLEGWKRASHRHERVLLVQDPSADAYQYFPLTDILLTDASSVMFYFLAFDRPIILVGNPQRSKDRGAFDPGGPEWTWRDFAIEISDVEELPAAVARSLDNPDEKSVLRRLYRERVFGNLLDGRAAERIANKIRALANPEPEDEDWVSASWSKIEALRAVDSTGKLADRLRVALTPAGRYLDRYPRLKHFLRSLLPE